MGKNKRKKKLKEQDFQKVKLKVGKKIQPAQNATDTSFKSRSIFIPTQLNNDLEPTNQRNQTLMDLLKQVGHYSVTTRQEALVGLKHLFQCHENLLKENLGIVIKRVAEKMTDSEPSVRQSLLLLLCFIFPMVPQERMAPFASLVVAHLSCAMTHIYDDIQHDSLGFLELCLRHFPALMVTSSSQLIHNFVGMISHQSTSQTKKATGLQKKAGRLLSVNPKGKLSSLRSRLKVLQQLLAFLKALETSPNVHPKECSFPSVSNVVESVTKPVFQFSTVSPTQVQVLQHSVDEPRLPSFIFDHESSSTTITDSNILTDEEKMKHFMDVIVPLLLECWIECNPVQMTTGFPDIVMSSSAIDVMFAIAEIFKVIFRAAQRNQKNSNCTEQSSKVNWLQEIYFNDLNQHFMKYFPFTASCIPLLKKGIKRKLGNLPQQSEEEKNGTSVMALNLTTCEIMLQFVSSEVAFQKNFLLSFEKLEEFIFECFELKTKGGTAKAKLLQAEHMESLVKLANKVIVYHCSCGHQDPGRIKELLEVAFNLFQSSHLMSGTKRAFMLFFANLAFLDDSTVSRHVDVQGVTDRWLHGLPGLLVQLRHKSPGMTQLVVDILKRAVMRGALKPDDHFLTHLVMFFSRSRGPFCTLSESIQRSAVELLFHLPTLDDKLLQVIVCCCHDDNMKVSVFQYILQILHYRSPCYERFHSHPAAFSLPLYLSALFTVAIGFSRHMLAEYQDAMKQKKNNKHIEFKECSFIIIMEETTHVDQSGAELSNRQFWDDHQKKLQAVLQCFRQCKQSKLLLQYMASILATFLDDFKVLPLTVAHSFLSVLKCLMELASEAESPASSHSFPAQTLSNLAQLSLVCLKHLPTLETCTEGLTYSVLEVKRQLFDAAVGLLLAIPPVTTNVLSLLLNILAANTLESLRQDCAAILTNVFGCEVRKILLKSPDVVQLIVSRILCPEDPLSCQKQCFADLQYQFSLFKVEAGLS